MATKKPRVMVIGDGRWQVPIIRKLQDAGFAVVNTGNHPMGPGSVVADIHAKIEPRDELAHIQLAEQMGVVGVLTDQTDNAVVTVAAVAAALGLPGIGRDTALRFTNKYFMRLAAQQYGIKQPRFRAVISEQEVRSFHSSLHTESVLKPLDGQSSRLVSVVRNPDEAASALVQIQSVTGSRFAICEEAIQGTEFTVEGVVVDGVHKTLAVSRKTPFSSRPTVARRLTFSRPDRDLTFIQISNFVDDLVTKFELRFGLTHTEVKVNDKGVWLIETAARGGGTLISSLIVQRVAGVDPNSILIQAATEGKVELCSPRFSNEIVVLEFFDLGYGMVHKLHVDDRHKGIPEILEIGINISEGDRIAAPSDDSARHMFVIAAADSEANALERARAGRDVVSVDFQI